MFFESFLLNLSVVLVLIVALVFDYVTKFFSYWYVRHIPYKQPSVPFIGSDYHRVFGVRSSTEDVNKLYTMYPKDKFVGRIKCRIPDLIAKDPDAVKRLLSTDFANFHSRGLCLDKSQDVCLRDNLYYADGEKWTLLRQGYESLLNNMNVELESPCDCLQGTNGDANVQQALSKVLDKIFKDLLIGHNVEGSIVEVMSSAIQKRTLIGRFKSYLKDTFPSLYVMFGLTTVTGEPSANTKQILEKSKILSHIKNLGNVYKLGVNEKSRKHSDVDFAFTVLSSFITEGYIPCLNILTAILFEMAWNPQVQDKSRNSVSKDNGEDYLDVAIKEALRLYPPYSIITRQCTKTYQNPEGHFVIDKKVTINVPVEAIHKDDEHYKNAKVFNPDRFMDDEGSSKHCYAYLPFGAGPKKCIGEQLALRIIRSVTKEVLQKYEIVPSDMTPTKLTMVDHDFGRVVDRDIWLRFKPRV